MNKATKQGAQTAQALTKPSTTSGLPSKVAEVFEAMRQEVTFMHATWAAFQQLYGTENSVAVLNGTAPEAFRLIQLLFRRELIMGVCRISDPQTTGKKENLTLRQLLDVVTKDSRDSALIARMESKLTAIDAICEPFRVRRNRSIGHLDLETALNVHSETLPAIEHDRIGKCLTLIAQFMNEVLGFYTTAYADFVPPIKDSAQNIVHGLREFQRLRKTEYEREIAALCAEGS